MYPTSNFVTRVEHARLPQALVMIESVLAQSRKADEIIVVDDGSRDHTGEVLAGFGNAIEVITQPNAGVSKARNTGCARATGTWLAFLDSDDVWEPDRLAVLERDVAHADDSILVHLADLHFLGPDYAIGLYEERRLSFPKRSCVVVDDALPLALPGLCPISVAVRRSALEEVGGFDETLPIYEDLFAFSTLALKGRYAVTGAVVAKCQRLDGDAIALTTIETRRAELARSCLVYAYRNLLGMNPTKAQRIRLEAGLSGALHALAQTQWGSDRAKAREALFEAAKRHPNPAKGYAKSIAPLLLGKTGFRHSRRNRKSFDRG